MLRTDSRAMTSDAMDAVLAFISKPAFRGTVKPKDAVRLVRVVDGYWTPIRKSKFPKSNLTIYRT